MCDVAPTETADNGLADCAEEATIAQPVEEDSPNITIAINNVVCSFTVRCHLNLRKIASEGMNVEFKKENGMVTMKLRKPYTTASIWSSGKITCTGATSEEEAKIAARRFSRVLQNMGFRARFSNYRVVNVLGTCSMPFGIKIGQFSQEHKKAASYEPELHPGVTYRIPDPKATLKVFSTGSITITAPCVGNIQTAVEHIFPLVYAFKMDRIESQDVKRKTLLNKLKKRPLSMNCNGPTLKKVKYVEDLDEVTDEFDSMSEETDDFDTDESFD
ncbi:TATA box-binding protein-like 1 [Lineus longissimus]|uniref:TATA box-binding protein-like 1 n=1 Tax=Lineus longissimus TaxID=88925 RepID=UPI002B4E7836